MSFGNVNYLINRQFVNIESNLRPEPLQYLTRNFSLQHMFREPEVRPPLVVSNLFTGLCFAPVFLLLILWTKLGVNISNFPLSLSALVFHLGLGGENVKLYPI